MGACSPSVVFCLIRVLCLSYLVLSLTTLEGLLSCLASLAPFVVYVAQFFPVLSSPRHRGQAHRRFLRECVGWFTAAAA